MDEQGNREAAIAEVVLKLSALDRYERRSLSRRKFAIRDWDDYGRKRNEADCAIGSPSQEIDPNRMAAAPSDGRSKRAALVRRNCRTKR